MTAMLQPNSQSNGGAAGVIDVLVEGLRISEKTLNEKCRRALLCFGGRAALRVQAVSIDPNTSAAHRRRLEEVLGVISDSEQISTGAGTSLQDALLDALRVTNKRLNEKAIAAFAALPWRTIDMLIAEAVSNHEKAAGYCARLLKAAGVVDGSPDVMQRLNLMGLMSSNDQAVRQLAYALVWKLRSSELQAIG